MKFRTAVFGLLAAVIFSMSMEAAAKPARGSMPRRSAYQDLFFGPRLTKSADFESKFGKYSDVGVKTGVTMGARWGYWHNQYVGGAIDVFSYDSSAKKQNSNFSGPAGNVPNVPIDENSGKIETKAIAFDILGRYPLGSIFMPYVGIAPTIYLNHAVLLNTGSDGSGVNFGFQIPLGMKYMLLKRDRVNFGLLSEVRFTYNPVSAGISNGGGDAKMKLWSTHFLFGATVEFGI